MTTTNSHRASTRPPWAEFKRALTLVASSFALASLSFSSHAASITLIIDDIGHQMKAGMRAVNLPGEVTLSVLPNRPHSQTLAKAGHQAGKAIMLHLPMENLHERELGACGITTQMPSAEQKDIVQRCLKEVPHIIGINNHMGSLLTQSMQSMDAVLEVIKGERLFFVDSRTTPRTVAGERAQLMQVPYLQRDVFLDHDPDPKAIAAAFRELIVQAKRKGHAVAIGHPYPQTLALLERELPKLKEYGVSLVNAPRLILALNRGYPEGHFGLQASQYASLTAGIDKVSLTPVKNNARLPSLQTSSSTEVSTSYQAEETKPATNKAVQAETHPAPPPPTDTKSVAQAAPKIPSVPTGSSYSPLSGEHYKIANPAPYRYQAPVVQAIEAPKPAPQAQNLSGGQTQLSFNRATPMNNAPSMQPVDNSWLNDRQPAIQERSAPQVLTPVEKVF